jgi:hypothetical protein
VQRVLATLLAPASPNARVVRVEVTDFGGDYAVAVGGREKKYTDPNRDCEGRARIAAAFIALVLSPEGEASVATPAGTTQATSPSAPASATSSSPPAPSAPSAAPPVASVTLQNPGVPPAPWLRAGFDIALDLAPTEGLFGAGGTLGVAAGVGSWGAQVHCGWLGGTSITAPGGNGSVLIDRFPCVLAPVLRFFGQRSGLVEASADAGIALGALHARGSGFAQNYDSVRLEVGVRAGADVVFHFGRPGPRLAPRIGVAATYEPAVYDLLVSPRGVVAHTPSLWAGVTAGVSWSME